MYRGSNITNTTERAGECKDFSFNFNLKNRYEIFVFRVIIIIKFLTHHCFCQSRVSDRISLKTDKHFISLCDKMSQTK